MQKTIYLLRHGEPVGGDGRMRGRTDDPLTPLGWQQMQQAVESIPCEQIYSSPLQRCALFAQQLAADRNIECRISKQLIEMGMGAWEGKRKSELMPTLADQWQYARHAEATLPADAEPFADIRTRAQQLIRIWQQDPNERLLVVAHAGIIRFIMAELLGYPAEAALRIKLPFATCIRLEVHWNEQDNAIALWQL